MVLPVFYLQYASFVIKHALYTVTLSFQIRLILRLLISKYTFMKKTICLCIALVGGFFMSNAQSLSNLVFEKQIKSTTTTVKLTFDYSGVSKGDVFEWQLFVAQPDGTPDWKSGRNIAWQGNVVPTSVGSGTQTLTFDVYNDPAKGEVFTWVGKITLASDGSDTGYNNKGNLVTVKK